MQLAALRATFDLLLLHSPAAVVPLPAPAPPADADAADAAADADADGAADGSEDPAAVPLGSLLLPLLSQPAGELRSTAAIGLAKLFHAGASTILTHICMRL